MMNAELDAQVIHLDLQNEQANKDGAKLLFDVSEFLGRFNRLSERACADRAHSLDRAHSYDGGVGDNAAPGVPLSRATERQDQGVGSF